MVLYRLVRILFKLFAKLSFQLKIEGLENLPKQTGFILAVNHASSLDPFVITAAIPYYIRWLVIYEYYDLWYLGWILKRLRFIRLKKSLSKEAFKALAEGEIIGIFPEGRRSWDGRLGKARRGVATLARVASCPVVPVAIQGTFAALPRTRRLFQFHPVTVRIGKPLFFSAALDSEDSERLDQENTQRIMQHIAELLY